MPRRLHRRRLALALPLIPALAAGVALAAAGAAKPATPTISSGPANPTNQTSAHLAYADAFNGASFECRLDGALYSSCPVGGATYPGPLAQGPHIFKVRALLAGKTSGEATYSWTVDTTPPTAAIAFPVDGSALNSATWGHGCPQGVALCGSARDGNAVSTVSVSIQQAGGKWWGGSAFDRAEETFLPAVTAMPGRTESAWSYSLPMPADGSYTIHVRATDRAGNTTAAAAQGAASFTIHTIAPPTPTFSSGPEAQTVLATARFLFADSQAGVSFLCTRDSNRAKACASPVEFGGNARGTHTFAVQARDAAGNLSPRATWTWSVVKAVESGKPFTVSGNASSALSPGISSPIAVTVTNPNTVAITVTELNTAVAATSSKPGCEGPANLLVTQSNVAASNPLAIPAGGHVSLPSGSVTAPQVLMRDLNTNQDACKNASFTFDYSGSAHS